MEAAPNVNLADGGKKMTSTLTADTTGSQFDQYSQTAELLDWTVDRLTTDHIKQMERCNKYKQEDARRHFDYIATNYEGLYGRAGWPDPKQVADMVKEMFKNKNPNEVNIIDFGCGTGLVGKELAEHGFTKITGVDISPAMLEIASDKGCYTTLEEMTLGDPNNFPDNLKNKFDVVVCSGLINNNHLDYRVFEEMIWSLKKGGFLVFAARFSFMGNFWYNETLEEMCQEKRLKLVKSAEFFKYDKLVEGIGRFAKTPCKVFGFQNLCDEVNGWKKKKVFLGGFSAFPKEADS